MKATKTEFRIDSGGTLGVKITFNTDSGTDYVEFAYIAGDWILSSFKSMQVRSFEKDDPAWFRKTVEHIKQAHLNTIITGEVRDDTKLVEQAFLALSNGESSEQAAVQNEG